MIRYIIVLLVAFLAVGGCGGGGNNGDGCDFDILSLTNGPNVEQANSVWDCENTLDEIYEFVIFENGEGFSTGLGGFEWEQTGCRSLDLFVPGLGFVGEVFNIDGNFQQGFLVYDELLTTKPATTAGCVLVVLQ